MTNKPKLHISIFDLMRAAIGLATIDGGFVIGVQVINFLIAYFGMRLPVKVEQLQNISVLSPNNFLILTLGMLNLAAIIYRLTGLARGVKYSALLCYKHALRRSAALMLLYLLGSLIVFALTIPTIKIFSTFSLNTPEQYAGLFMFLLLTLMPYGIFACIFVVDQENTPVQAIRSTWKIVKEQISIALLIRLSLIYCLPSVFGMSLIAKHLGQHIGLFNAVWFLFCHIITVIIYTGTLIKASVQQTDKKLTTIIA